MTRGHNLEIQLYLDLLERDYGPGFDFSRLSNDELSILEALTRHALGAGHLKQGEREDLHRIMPDIDRQWAVRGRYRWLNSWN